MSYLHEKILEDLHKELIDIAFCIVALINAGVPDSSPARKLLECRHEELLQELSAYE